MTRVLVTGGAGVIGSHLVDRLLADGHHVVATDDLSSGKLHHLQDARRDPDKRFAFQRVDVVSNAFEVTVAKARPEVVVHLASRADPHGGDDPARDAMIDVVGTVNLIEACRTHDVRKVVYASHLDDRGAAPGTPFLAGKRAAEEYLRALGAPADGKGPRWTILSLAEVYGPRQDPATPRHLVARLADWMRERAPVTLAGGPDRAWDLLAVEDAVEAFVLALDAGDGMRVDIGSGAPTTQATLVTALAELTAWKGEPQWLAADPAPAPLVADLGRAAALGWQPRMPLEDGLRALLRWLNG